MNARVWNLSEEQIKGVIHPRSMYWGKELAALSIWDQLWGDVLGTGDR